MNNIFISHTSAFKIYRRLAIQNLRSELTFTKISPTRNLYYNEESLKSLELEWANLCHDNLDVLAPSSNAKHGSKKFRFHIHSGDFPPGSFYKLCSNVFIVSPELLFCQMAQYLSIEKLLLLGFELSGTYSINNESESGFENNIQPWTSVEKINKYINQLRNCNARFYGINKSALAAKYILDNSASPQESRAGIILGASRKIGAFGIKNLVMNSPVVLSKPASEICGQCHVFPDLSIPEYKIAIEYDSDAYHDNINQNRHDKKRIDALQHDGWQVFTFVADQLYNVNVLKHMAKDILKANGQSARIRTADFDVLLSKLLQNLK